jgi:hypothetical protein
LTISAGTGKRVGWNPSGPAAFAFDEYPDDTLADSPCAPFSKKRDGSSGIR